MKLSGGMLLYFLTLLVQVTNSLDNGLALTPPMGWLSWQRYRCNTDCANDPDNCLSEQLLKKQADCLVKGGFRELGYQYITIDDCWLEPDRDNNRRLQPDKKRFPSGMKALADYMHSKGLKLGIYEDFGTKTCAGYPGSEFYMQLDAQTFADWEIDLLKFDGCNSNKADQPFGYAAMAMYLNMTGREILYSCEWPLYVCKSDPQKCDFSAIREACNMWRNYWDVQDAWNSVRGVLQYFQKHGDFVRRYAGSGGWNDPDMLVIGNYGLSVNEERAQMALWAVMASPLIMSNDLCNLSEQSKNILQNKRLLAINQDKLGIQGSYKQTINGSDVQIWVRPISPAGSYAIAFLNLGTGGGPHKVSMTCKTLGLTSTKGYNIMESFDGKNHGSFLPKDTFTAFVNPSGVYLITATLKSKDLATDHY